MNKAAILFLLAGLVVSCPIRAALPDEVVLPDAVELAIRPVAIAHECAFTGKTPAVRSLWTARKETAKKALFTALDGFWTDTNMDGVIVALGKAEEWHKGWAHGSAKASNLDMNDYCEVISSVWEKAFQGGA